MSIQTAFKNIKDYDDDMCAGTRQKEYSSFHGENSALECCIYCDEPFSWYFGDDLEYVISNFYNHTCQKGTEEKERKKERAIYEIKALNGELGETEKIKIKKFYDIKYSNKPDDEKMFEAMLLTCPRVVMPRTYIYRYPEEMKPKEN